MKFFQDNQLFVYSIVVITAVVCVVVGVFLALEEKGTVQVFYYEDGVTVERKVYYRGDESLEKIEFHEQGGTLFQTSYYQTNEDTLERVETLRDNGTTQFIDYIDSNGGTTKLEEYREDGTLYSVTYVENELNTTNYYDKQGKNLVSTPVE